MVWSPFRRLAANIAAFRRVIQLFSASSWLLAALAIASVLTGLADALVIALVVEVAAAIATHGRRVDIHHLGSFSLSFVLVATIIIVIIGALLGLIAAYIPVKIAAASGARLRRRTLQAFLGAEWEHQVGVRQGGFVDLLTQQTEQATLFVIVFGSGVSAFLIFAGMAASAATISPVAFLGVVVIAAILFLVMKPFAKLGQRHAKLFSAAFQDFAGEVDTIVGMAEEINVFGRSEEIQSRVATVIDDIRRHRTGMGVIQGGINSLYTDIATLGLIACLIVLARVPHLDLAALGAVVLILLRAMSSGQLVQSCYTQLRQQLPFVQRLQTVLRDLEGGISVIGNDDLAVLESIELRDVQFAYLAPKLVLRGLSAFFDKGQLVAIVGPSGAGKSTLLQILLRLRSPDQGDYLINGRPASCYSAESWAREVAYVPQDSRVLSASIAENIRFFRDIPLIDLVAASKAAQIYNDIMALPDGFETVIGQRLDALSGGQRQRLCLARALAGQPQVLILDEPTSALDDVSESLVHEALAHLRGRVTTIVVAHRPGILKVCDRVFTLREGVIVSEVAEGHSRA